LASSFEVPSGFLARLGALRIRLATWNDGL